MPRKGVILMSFGTVASNEEVPAFLSRVRGGRPVPAEVVTEMQRRYTAVGGSPLLRITREQAAALQARLGSDYKVVVGMRNAAPFIVDAVKELADAGVGEAVGIIMAPQHSPMIMKGYHDALAAAQATLGSTVRVRTALAWHDVPGFKAALAQRVREALGRLPTAERATVPVLMSTHSLPRPVVEAEPQYLQMLRDTAKETAQAVGLAPGRWQFAYQSAGHTPEEWLRPDIKEIFPALAQAGHKSVLIVPVQFVADHMEILYDIDIAAQQQAPESGLTLHRLAMQNTMPEFIEALAQVVEREEKRRD